MQEFDADEVDVAVIDAVRTAPRGSWRDLGSALGLDPSTVSRRWARLEAAGMSWVTAHPSGAATPVCALVELDCEPGRSAEVARGLILDPEAATIKITSGGRDVVLLAQAASLDDLSDYLLNLVPRIPGIARVRSHVLTRSTIEPSRWRDGALSPQQQRLLTSRIDDAPIASVMDDVDRRILAALHEDGRMSLERVGDRAGVGALAVRRRLNRLQAGGLMTLRCDVSRQLSGRAVWAMYFGSTDVQDLREVEDSLRSLSGVRAASFAAGPFNVVVDAWLRSASEVHDFERRMGERLPGLHVLDRSVVLKMVKLLGRVLDAGGRSVSVVPLLREHVHV